MKRQRIPHVDDPRAVGERLRSARERAGLSQRRLSFPGCTPAYLSRLEAGERTPSLQLLRELARRLAVSADWLATGRDAAADHERLVDAELALRLGQHEQAEHAFRELADGSDDPIVRGRALGGLGQLAFRRGELTGAIGFLEQARGLLGASLARHTGLVETLGKAYEVAGEAESSVAVFEWAAGTARSGGDEIAADFYTILLANALVDNGSFGRASELLGGLMARLRTKLDPVALARLHWSQSRLHAVSGDHDLAARHAERALAALELTEHRQYAARAHHLLAYVELERGNATEALELLRSARAEVEESGDAYTLCLFRLEEARALVALGQVDEARELAIEVAAELAPMSTIDAVRAFGVVADVCAATGDVERAIELYSACADDLAAAGSPLASDLYARCSRLLEEQGRADEALLVLKKAVEAQSGSRLPIR